MGKAVRICHCAATVTPRLYGAGPSRKTSLRVRLTRSGESLLHRLTQYMKHRIAPERSTTRTVLALALASSCAYAQVDTTTTAAADEIELPPVTVSAHEGSAVPYDQTGVSVTVLDTDELRREGIYTLTEALTTAPGVYVLPGGGKFQRGNISDLVVRGMASQKYVMPMMDGMRLSSGMASNGLVAGNIIARTPLFGIGSLELLRGAEGAVYGSGAMAGVLFMETPEGKGDPSLTLFNEFGSFDSYTGSAIAQGRVKDTSFYVSGTYERTNNNTRFLDGSIPKLSHAGKYENWSESVRLDHRFNDRNRTTLTYRREDSSYNNYSNYDDEPTLDRYDFRTNLVTLKHQIAVSDRYSTSLMVGYYGSVSDYATGYVQKLDNVQVEWRNAYRWNEKNCTTAGISWTRTDFTTKDSSEVAKYTSSLDSVFSFAAEHTVEPVKGWLNSLAVRLDHSEVYGGKFTLRAAESYKFNDDRTRLFASAGRGYAAPGSFERSASEYRSVYHSEWGDFESFYHGNPNLKCENNWSFDAGIEQQLVRNHYLSATYFWSRTKNGIYTDSDDFVHYTFYNDPAHQTNQGVELAMRGTWEHAWNTGYKLAFTYARPKRNDDTQLPGTARRVWSAEVHTSPWERFTTGLGLSAAGDRRGYAGGRLDDYLVLRWYARYAVTDNLSVHLRVENLTNQKYVLDEDTYGGPATTWISSGAAIYAGCTYTF